MRSGSNGSRASQKAYAPDPSRTDERDSGPYHLVHHEALRQPRPELWNHCARRVASDDHATDAPLEKSFEDPQEPTLEHPRGHLSVGEKPAVRKVNQVELGTSAEELPDHAAPAHTPVHDEQLREGALPELAFAFAFAGHG